MRIIVSVIVPVWNEAEALPTLLATAREQTRPSMEWIFVDGGSTDNSADLILAAGQRLLTSEKGRARQMNVGAAASQGELLFFLHADSRVDFAIYPLLSEAFTSSAKVWGRFDIAIEGQSRLFPLIAAAISCRSRWSGIATGDQGIFVRRESFEAIGGFPLQPLMEDIAICRRLLALSRPLCCRSRLVTSGRRWDKRGVWRTIFLMWQLRWLYWRGASPEFLARRYR